MSVEYTAQFADVLLPLKVPQAFTYRLPDNLVADAVIGKRVEVSFGKQKIYAGLITRLHHDAPQQYVAKPVLSILDDKPMITETHLRFWEWLSAYYMCALGEVMNAALPAGFKLDSESYLVLNPNADMDFSHLDDKEYLIAEALTMRRELTITEAQKILGIKTVRPVISSLVRKNIVFVNETVTDKYKPKLESYVFLNGNYSSEESRSKLVEQFNNSAKRQNMLLAWFQLHKQYHFVTKKELFSKSGGTDAMLKSLIELGIFHVEKRDVYRLNEERAQSPLPELSAEQREAYNQLKEQFETHSTVLLHGVTSSGKTTIYMHYIKEVLQRGGQVLYLLPEIAITQQMINRLRICFGEEVGIYHSMFNNNERVEIWNKLHNGFYKIIVAARSGLFMPFTNLELVIVDEEHESSYKQQEPAPRYHARDAALYLAHIFPQCRTLLGSATPGLETYFNAKQGKYGYVQLNSRFGDVMPPKIDVADMQDARTRKIMVGSFTPVAINNIKESMAHGEQVIIFQNRRGFAPFLQCTHCAWVPICPNCDVSLTYYKYTNDLRCHYCNFRARTYTECTVCKNKHLELKGAGTEKLEEELQQLFPKARIARMDSDTTRTKYKQNKLISDVELKNVDVLVGTQMVVKGLDFAHVNSVIIPEADRLFFFPDFRSSERGFQMLMQVSGRAGRRQKQGHVIIQAAKKDNPILQFVINADYSGFYDFEIALRKEFAYPPFARLILIEFKHADAKIAKLVAAFFFGAMSRKWGSRVFQPTEPVVNKVHNKYRMQVMLKFERDNTLVQQAKKDIKIALNDIEAQAAYRQVQTIIDVDPY